MVVVVQGCPQQTDRSFEETVRMASELAASGIKPKQAAAKASEESGLFQKRGVSGNDAPEKGTGRAVKTHS